MRLRRETGDFRIKLTAGLEGSGWIVNTISKDLLPEDFVGQIIEINGGYTIRYSIITGAGYKGDDKTVVNMSLADGGAFGVTALEYVRATGEITVKPAS